MALDGDKRPSDAIASNAGQALWGGIVDRPGAPRWSPTLTGPELDSGWGDPDLRGRAAGLQPARLPHRVGLAPRQRADRGRHEALRLRPARRAPWPAGSSRPPSTSRTSGCPSCTAASIARDVGVPVPYPVACSPQAWSAASPLLLVRTMLGARASAARPVARARPAPPADVARQADGDRPARRRRVGRPAVPPLARHDERRGPAARPATSRSRSGSDPTRLDGQRHGRPALPGGDERA